MTDKTYSYKRILSIALPLMFANGAYMAVSLADTAFMGKVGSVEQATIGYYGLFYQILIILGFAYTKGLQILVAKMVGSKQEDQVGVLVDNALVVLETFAILVFIFLFWFSTPVLDIIVASDAILEKGNEYFNYRSFGLFFTMAATVFIAYYSGIGKTFILLIALLTMAGLNIFFNWVLVFGKFGFEPMGIAGAGLASALAEGLGFLVLITNLLYSKYTKQYGLFKFKDFSLTQVNKLTHMAGPLVVQSLVGLGAWFVFFSFVEKMGEFELAVSNVVKMIYQAASIPTYSLVGAESTVISNLMGEGKPRLLWVALRRILLLSILFSGAIALIMVLFPTAIIGVFTNDPVQIEATYNVYYVAIVALICYSVTTVFFNAVVASGSTKVSMTMEILTISMYLIYVYVVFNVLQTSLHITWTSELAYWIVNGIMGYFYLKSGRWKKRAISAE